MVWDYSLENIKVLNMHGVNNTLHVPLGYAPTMENSVAPAHNKDIDVIFVGEINSRRRSKLQQFDAPAGACLAHTRTHAGGVTLKTVFSGNCWGHKLLSLYSRTKVALNLHYYGGRTILEVHRILPLIVSRVLVLSEPSDDRWLDESFRGLVTFLHRDSIIESVINILKLNTSAEAEQRYAKLVSSHRYTNSFQTAFNQQLPLPWRHDGQIISRLK